MYKQTPDGLIFAVKITPKAHTNEILGWENKELKIRLRAIPEKGEANDKLIDFLAKELKISKSDVAIISGFTSRHKRLCLKNFREFLERYGSSVVPNSH